VLHIAPEPIIQRRLRARANVRYLSADLESPRADKHFDLTSIPYPDASFDVIICMHVLEHIPDDRAAMREMRRVLAPDGWALLQVPFGKDRETTFEDWSVVTPEDRIRVFGQSDHVRIYGRDYVERLRDAGFVVQVDSAIRNLPTHLHQRYGLKPEDMYVCRPASDSL
jgi:SAM-dependent methyltransferase